MIDKSGNPWLGLESYKENQIIYGRNTEVTDLAQRVLNDTDTVVYGKSGIGKTSVINAGVLPIARLNDFVPIVVRLDHGNTTSYIKQLDGNIRENVEVEDVRLARNAEKELFWEYFHRHLFFVDGKRKKLLIVFDQFEEIFTLQQNPSARLEFFRSIGDVLNGMMPKVLTDNFEKKLIYPKLIIRRLKVLRTWQISLMNLVMMCLPKLCILMTTLFISFSS